MMVTGPPAKLTRDTSKGNINSTCLSANTRVMTHANVGELSLPGVVSWSEKARLLGGELSALSTVMFQTE